METFSLVAIALREERRRRRHGKGRAVALVQPVTGDFAHQGHRTDLADERLVSHREARWIDGQRFEWNGKTGCWHKAPAKPLMGAKPVRHAPTTTVKGGSVQRDARLEDDAFTLRKLRELADAGIRPEELTIVVGRRLK